MRRECRHGSLARQCEICERDERILELERVVRLCKSHTRSIFGASHPVTIAINEALKK